ncbi:MAG: hypothetical protein VZR11_08395 [Succinimonas sp.]|nr:hypothetical protein [Succinimonas sp.]
MISDITIISIFRGYAYLHHCRAQSIRFCADSILPLNPDYDFFAEFLRLRGLLSLEPLGLPTSRLGAAVISPRTIFLSRSGAAFVLCPGRTSFGMPHDRRFFQTVSDPLSRSGVFLFLAPLGHMHAPGNEK